MKTSKDWRLKCRDWRERSKYLFGAAGMIMGYTFVKREDGQSWLYLLGAWVLASCLTLWATSLSRAADNETFAQIRRQEEGHERSYRQLDERFLSLRVELIQRGMSRIVRENEESFFKRELAPPQ